MRGEFLLTAETLAIENGVYPGDTAVVGVSGGADSLTLLLTLKELGVRVVAAHFDHQLRAESAADAEWVRAFCFARGIPFALETADVAAAARASGESVEDTARRYRYRFLFSLAERTGAAAVAVGHHAGDQAETILTHLLRGSGLDGLGGMAGRSLPNEYSASIALIRPLLNIGREEIEGWLTARGITPLVDRTNADTRFTRNRVRHELIPYLETAFNPNLIATLTRGAEVLRADRAFLEAEADGAFGRAALETTAEIIRLDRERFLTEPAALRARIVRRTAERLGGLRGGITHALIRRALEFYQRADAGTEPLRTADWSEGRNLFAIGAEIGMTVGPVPEGALYARYYPLLSDGAGSAADPAFSPASAETIRVGNGRLTIEPVREFGKDQAVAAMKRDRFTVYLDADRVCGGLTVRPRRKDERFVPFGTAGQSVRVEDFLLNGKIPAKIRGRYPLVCDAAGALWIVGLRTAERAALTESTRRALRLSWTAALDESGTRRGS